MIHKIKIQLLLQLLKLTHKQIGTTPHNSINLLPDIIYDVIIFLYVCLYDSLSLLSPFTSQMLTFTSLHT